MSGKKQKIIVRFIQGLIILIPCGLFFWLSIIAIVPSGVFVVERTVNERSPYLDRLLPDARVETPYQEADGDWIQKIVGDPVFFFVHPQRSFDSVKTEVRFKNTNVPIIEFGVLADKTTGAYTLEPLQNLIIDNSDWFRLEKDDIVLLQRNKKFASFDAFLAAPPKRAEIASYHYDWAAPYRLNDYQPSNEVVSTVINLRGTHEFYTYIKNETLSFQFGLIDLNCQIGEDVVNLVVVNEVGQVVVEESLADDSNANGNCFSSGLRTMGITAADLPEGVYKIQMKAGRDIVFKFIFTNQQKITFLNQLWLAEGGESGANFLTEGKNLKFVTRLAAGTQTLNVGGETVEIAAPFVEYQHAPTAAGLVAVTAPRANDLLVRANGHFAFLPSQYFNPDLFRLTAETDLDRLGINYIIAEYAPPRQDGEWLAATAILDTSNVSFDEKTWKFVISAPTAGQDDRDIFVNSIKTTFKGTPLTFGDILNKLFSYVLEKTR